MNSLFLPQFDSYLKAGLSFLKPEQRQALQKKLTSQVEFLIENDVPAEDFLYTGQSLIIIQALESNEKTTELAKKIFTKLYQASAFELTLIASLCQVKSMLPASFEAKKNRSIINRLDKLRCPDHGWNQAQRVHDASIFGTWLALSCYQYLQSDVSQGEKMAKIIQGFESPQGGFPALKGEKSSLISSSMALSILAKEDFDLDPLTLRWIQEQRTASGGFAAFRDLAIADAVSSCHALVSLKLFEKKADIENSQAYFLNLTDANGLFKFHENQEEGNIEATYFSLVALGLVDSF